MARETIRVIFRSGCSIWGPGPGGPASVYMASPKGEAHAVPVQLAMTLIGEGRAYAADPAEIEEVRSDLVDLIDQRIEKARTTKAR